MSVSSLPSDSFLTDVSVYAVNDRGELQGAVGAPWERLAAQAVSTGTAELSVEPDQNPSDGSASIAIPVYRSGRVASVAVLSAKQAAEGESPVVGVFEVWEPVGIYEELGLKAGFYGKMDRFRNVSSFVRFEKGNGLPGQVWQERSSVIHDDLPNHPGFLRAAGASADRLVTALGIPVASGPFHASVLLISSSATPLARGMEVWHASDEGWSLLGGAYRGWGDGIALPPEARLPEGQGLPGAAGVAGGAVLCQDLSVLFAGRNHDATIPDEACGLAIPYFDGDRLSSVATLLF